MESSTNAAMASTTTTDTTVSTVVPSHVAIVVRPSIVPKTAEFGFVATPQVDNESCLAVKAGSPNVALAKTLDNTALNRFPCLNPEAKKPEVQVHEYNNAPTAPFQIFDIAHPLEKGDEIETITGVLPRKTAMLPPIPEDAPPPTTMLPPPPEALPIFDRPAHRNTEKINSRIGVASKIRASTSCFPSTSKSITQPRWRQLDNTKSTTFNCSAMLKDYEESARMIAKDFFEMYQRQFQKEYHWVLEISSPFPYIADPKDIANHVKNVTCIGTDADCIVARSNRLFSPPFVINEERGYLKLEIPHYADAIRITRITSIPTWQKVEFGLGDMITEWGPNTIFPNGTTEASCSLRLYFGPEVMKEFLFNQFGRVFIEFEAYGCK